MISPADFYPSTGTVTSLISLENGKPVARKAFDEIEF